MVVNKNIDSLLGAPNLFFMIAVNLLSHSIR